MEVRMAGFSVKERQRLLNKKEYVDEMGDVDYERLVSDLDKVTEKMDKEIRLLQAIY
jgi:hypothetical protein